VDVDRQRNDRLGRRGRQCFKHRRQILRRCRGSDTNANTFSDPNRDSHTDVHSQTDADLQAATDACAASVISQAILYHLGTF
jgi:hypothetical protein